MKFELGPLHISFREHDKETTSLPADEQAYSEDAIFQFKELPKYNPDDLIGKKGHSVYRKMMLDEQVKAVVRFKRDAITSRKWSLEIPEEGKEALSDDEQARRISIMNIMLERIEGSFTDKLNGMLSSLYQGFSMTEKVFEQFDYDGLSYWGLKRLKLKPFDTFEFIVDEYGNTIRVVQKIAGVENKIDMGKFIHFVHNPDYDEQYGQSELREAYRSWFSKDMAITFWNMWLEGHASGHKWIQPKEGHTFTVGTTEYNSLVNVLNNTVNGKGMLLPGKAEMHLEFPSNNVAFKEAMETHDLGIAKALLVPNLMGITPSGQTGSFSQSNTQLRAFSWTLNADTKRLEEDGINDQLMRQLGEINFGDDYWPRFKFQPMSDMEIKELIETWNGLLEKNGVKATESDENFMRELLGVPKRSEDDKLIVDDKDNGDDKSSVPGPGGDNNKPDGVVDDKTVPDQSIKAKGQANILYAQFAQAKAAKRVDSGVLGKSSEVLESEHSDKIAMSLFATTKEWIDRFAAVYSFWPEDSVAKEVKKLRFDSKMNAKTQRLVATMEKDGWNLGQRHAENEIDKAKRTAFSMEYNKGRVELISEEFFKNKSFKVAGDLTNDAKAKIDTIVINGAKTGKTVQQIENEIYASFASNGLLAEEVMPLLAEALAGKSINNPQARIDTLVRTNLFEAINEARFAYFTDPALDGFVEALEYSAILDSRTTQVCSHLDGQVHATNSEAWDGHRPPNHYNCRSLLIPVTAIDKWTESDQPTVEPQEGFS